MSQPVLCYISEPWAYFTTQALDKQWGDDWNDTPYEHNAGEPYLWHDERDGEPYKIIKIAFEGNFHVPSDQHRVNNGYSVQRVNAGDVPWLHYPGWGTAEYPPSDLYAGVLLGDFIRWVQAHGGDVWLKLDHPA